MQTQSSTSATTASSEPRTQAEPGLLDWPDLEGLDDPERLRERVDRVPRWFHSFELSNGVRTSGAYDPGAKLHRIGLPERLDGQNVLDVGAWDGFYSFECERRGAASVTSFDPWDTVSGDSSEGYAVAHTALGSSAVPVRGSVHDLDPDRHGRFDLVLYLGVLYHLTNPYESLIRLRGITSGMCIIETESDFAFTRRPALSFFPTDELGNDESNWFSPNARALTSMCLAAGFSAARVAWAMPLHMRVARAAHRFRLYGEHPLRSLSRGRIVVHAKA